MRWRIRLAPPLGRCPPGWKLTRAVSRGLDAEVGWHLSACDRCAAELRALRRLADGMGALPEPRMEESAREALGARLLANALAPIARDPGRPAVRLAIAAATAVALTLVGFWAAWRAATSGHAPLAARPASGPWLGAVRAIGDARFERTQRRPDEIVRLDDGTIELDVARLTEGERFRVVTADGEVEVRGTAFDVSASHHKMVSVRVWRGRVEVRSSSGASMTLDAGDEWVGATASPTPPRQPGSVAVAALAHDAGGSRLTPPGGNRLRYRRATALKTTVSRKEKARPPDRPSFDDAWSLLKTGDPARAAAAFDLVARLAGEGGVVEDACYWRAVALTRAGQSGLARAAFVDFLTRFPASPRLGEASVILGWSLLKAGDFEAARAAFSRGARGILPTESALAPGRA